MIRVVMFPQGRRCWIFNRRVHHGTVGCIVAAYGAGKGSSVILAAGLLLMAHDRSDYREWFARERYR